MPFSILMLLLSQAFFAHASLPSSASLDSHLAVKFYRTPRSLFPSGEANRRELEKNWLQDLVESSYLVQREKRQFWVRASSVIRDLQLSQFVYRNTNQKTYRVQQTAGAYILGVADGQAPEWIPLSEVSPLPQDLGLAVTLITTQLRQRPSWKSDSVLSLPAGSRLQILKFEDTWLQVSFESVGRVTGWVDLNNLVLKHDFAAFAMNQDKVWKPVKYREGSDLVLSDNKRIPLQDVTALMTKPDLAISLVTDDSEKLLLRQNVTLLRSDFQSWSQSKISGHGLVYWKKDLSSPNRKSTVDKGLNIEDIMMRDLVAASFHPSNPNIAVVSAHGIYLTVDGKTWKKLPQFLNDDYPVLIDAQSRLYVGPQRSLDLGKTFSPYFRWEALTPLLEQKQKALVQQLKIRKLSSPRPGILKMEIETNLGAMSLAARAVNGLIQKWDFD